MTLAGLDEGFSVAAIQAPRSRRPQIDIGPPLVSISAARKSGFRSGMNTM